MWKSRCASLRAAPRGRSRLFRLVAITRSIEPPSSSGRDEIRIDRRDRQPPPHRLRGIPGLAFSGLDAAADAALCEFAARSHRGPELRPRMAARLRQAAAAALV